MLPVPWRYIQSWNCLACGTCCKGFQVVLDFPEWINIVKTYGVDFTQPGISRFYLKHKNDGTCIFLLNNYGNWLCSLQHMKPMACKLWPFKVSDRPKYGRPGDAAYNLTNMKLFIYADPACPGLRWGDPAREFVHAILPEFIDLAVGTRKKQFYSTSRLTPSQPWRLF